ncbi:hypothetical protein [Streptomyces tropicalis]|uniref:Lipoprotein n=1 Tax=Streptomyces tropicalis TaxID=3034234 RepID=A0ABT6A6I1_9ACTN|nr:hypothetical protein [Streptomyces tropicalis]MDF3300078.1 hypothetical protein [Streptomyces tropicalis]
MKNKAKGGVAVLLLLALTACSSGDRAVSPKEARTLAGSPPAVEARQQAEQKLRKVVQAYADHTRLSLGLVAVQDTCQTGLRKQAFFQDGSDSYKIKCSMRVTAYYGANPHRMGDVIDSILTAGDSDPQIPFTHDDTGKRLLAYYRDEGANPNGPGALDPSEIFAWGGMLTWDPVRDHNPKRLVDEPLILKSDPPLQRFLREPVSGTVSALRKEHGMVFRLELGSGDYYKVLKSGRNS